MGDKGVNFVRKLDILTRNSLYFWVYLFRGAVVYGLIVSLISLVEVVRCVRIDSDVNPKTIYKKNYEVYKSNKWISLILVAMLASTYSALFFINQGTGPVYKSLTLALLMLIITESLVLIYGTLFVVYRQVPFILGVCEGIIAVYKNVFASLTLFVFMGILWHFGVGNLVLLMFVCPSLFAYIASSLMLRLGIVEDRQENEANTL